MATWRIKGYVSDSEDEHDDLYFRSHGKVDHDNLNIHSDTDNLTTVALSGSSPTTAKLSDYSTPRHDGTTALPSSQILLSASATALQKSLSDGLAIIRDVLSRSSSPTGVLQSADDTESPLSTPPDSPVIPPLDLPAEPTSNVAAISSPPGDEMLPAQRTLRQRNAVQQAPYTLDRAKYMLSLVGSGHRPVRDIDTSKRTKRVEESQESTFEESSQALNSADVDMMDVELLADDQGLESLPSKHPDDNSSSWSSMTEELPDLQNLFGQSPKRHDEQRIGIHKVSTGFKNKGSRSPNGILTQTRKPMKLGKTPQSGISVEKQNSFPSPPRSTSATSIELLTSQGDQSPIRSPVLLPTPVVSSGLRRKRPVVEDDTQSISTRDPTPPESGTHDPSDSDGERSNSTQLRVMQRKIKGVLPASWWSIGRLQEDLNKKSRQGNHPATLTRPEVGVAQRKTHPSPSRGDGASRLLSLEDLASEESEDETNRKPENRHRQTSLPAWSPGTSPNPSSRDDEAVEILDNDMIDPMLLTQFPRANFRRNRQTDLRDVLLKGSAEPSRRRSSTSKARNANTGIGQRDGKKPRRKNLRRDDDILDAPDIRTNRHQDLPDFLRVAAKQARHRVRSRPPTMLSKTFTSPHRGNPMAAHNVSGLQRKANPISGSRIQQSSRSHLEAKIRVAGESSNFSRIRRGTFKAIPLPTQYQPEDENQALDIEGLTQFEQQPRSEGNATEQSGLAFRLTRLKYLLPLTNRSGYGRLASRTPLPRSAQFEEVEHLLKLPRRTVVKPATYPLPQRRLPISETVDPPARHETSQPAKLITRKKKQTPTKSRHTQQTLLVRQQPADRHLKWALESNDPNLRQLLHDEFTDYQTAWFQGRKLGQVCATTSTQHHFDVFLEILTAHISISAQDAGNSHDARELNSFLHRLLPNRREIGARGQIGDKVFDVLEQDVLVARNVFDLHVCLLNLAPGCAPRPRVLEMMVNFTQAHHEICKIALSAWEAIYKCHHVDASITRALTSWMYSILSQLVARWLAAENDARSDAEKTTNRVAESLIRQVIELNRTQACELLCHVHGILEASVRNATTTAEVNSLLEVEGYLKHLGATSRHSEMTEEVIKSALLITKSYFQFWKRWQLTATTMALLGGIRQSVTSITSQRRDLSHDMQVLLVGVYFELAQISIEQRHKHWDDFIEPTSSLNLDMFVPPKFLQSMKTIFFHFIVGKEKAQYFLEYRALILNHWISAVFRQSEDDAAKMLTLTILRSERESLSMPRLASTLLGPNASEQSDLNYQSLSEIRHHVVAHIIPCLYEQEHNPEGEWLVGGLEETDSVSLIRTMFSTMKEAWMSLSENPEEQDLYTILIHFALDHYETYPRSDFKIEPWFFNSATFPQRRKHTLVTILRKCETNLSNLSEAKDVLFNEILHAERFQRFMQLEADLKAILTPPPHDDVPVTSDEGKVWAVHGAFIREVFPAILNSTNSSMSQAPTMILNVLLEIFTYLECRLSRFELEPVRSFVAGMDSIVNSLAKAVHQWDDKDRSKAFVITSLIFDWSVSVDVELSEPLLGDIAVICDIASDDSSGEALDLLQTVIARR